MDRARAKVVAGHADTIRAFADGATIECKLPNSEVWTTVSNPSFVANMHYRVKKDPKELWLVLDKNDKEIGTHLYDKNVAFEAAAAFNNSSLYTAGAPYRAVLMREVEDNGK